MTTDSVCSDFIILLKFVLLEFPKFKKQTVKINQNTTEINKWKYFLIQSQWPSLLRHVLSSATRTLGSCVRIPLEAWKCVRVFLCCVVLCLGLVSDRSPIQGVLPTVQQIHKFQKINSEPEQSKRSNPWKTTTTTTTMMMKIFLGPRC
jgi:hypothetical protein